jgi:transposase
VPYSSDATVNRYVDQFYKRICDEKRIDIETGKQNVKKQENKDLQLIDVNSIKHKDVREIGAEWLSYQAIRQLKLDEFLHYNSWDEQEVKLALTHLISRAVYPASELETTRWIQENSAVCEITGFDITKITKDRLYKITHKLYSLKDQIVQYLSHRTNELFDIEDKIVLYDLTNTYFEGEKRNSKLAKYGRSKEKRSDAKLVVLALVVNVEGFIKYSSILEGNIADPKTLSAMIDKLRVKTSSTAKKALIVLDAGIATESNLELIKQKGYDYLCVTRSNKKKYTVEADAPIVSVLDNKKQRIELCSVKTGNDTDYYLKVASESKEQKERSMNAQFKERFEAELKKISDSLSKKSGVKLYDKVNQRIGRAKQKYPSIQRYYTIELECADNKIVTSIKWNIKEDMEINARSGIYFLRTSLPSASEDTVWKCYNTIREIESTFRVLKTDLDLRPIYHKNDDSTMAHLHLGLLAYWVVNTIRYQLKQKGVNSDWREIVRIANTQKAVTTTAQNSDENIIVIRNCSEPTLKAKMLYDTLKYKYYPFTKKKSVVLKSKFENYEMQDQPLFWSQ